MFELKGVDVREWARALSWIVWRRRLLLHVNDVAEVKVISNVFFLLVASAFAACLSVSICAQAVGLQMFPSGYTASRMPVGTLTDFAQQLVGAAMSVKDLHPNSWTVPLLLPLGVVLLWACALAWMARFYGKRKDAHPPSFRAWWLGMTGYLCVLTVVAAVVGLLYAMAETVFPKVRIIQQVNAVAFYLVVVLAVGISAMQAWRRTKGARGRNFDWELVALLPVLVVLLAELWILPEWAQCYPPSVYARSPSLCDPSTGTCTLALTLSDSGVLELARESRMTLELQDPTNPKREATASLRVKWLTDTRAEGIPLQLHADHLRYMRLQFEKESTGDRCPSRAFLSSPVEPFVTKAELDVSGLILGEKGRTKFISPIRTEVERPLPGWARIAMAACLEARPTPVARAMPASAPEPMASAAAR